MAPSKVKRGSSNVEEEPPRKRQRTSVINVLDECNQCGRPSSLFGWEDIESGWWGWCRICNWKRKLDLVVHMIDELPCPPPARACMIDCLVDKSALGRIQAAAMSKAWERILLGRCAFYEDLRRNHSVFWKFCVFSKAVKRSILAWVTKMLGPPPIPRRDAL